MLRKYQGENDNNNTKYKKKAMKETILAVSGKPGLYRLVSRGKANLILETLDEAKKRIPAFASDRVTSLADIAMYTEDEDMPLWQVLKNMSEKESAQSASIDFKKASAKELREYFAEILPSYDRDRVRDSDIRKLIQWYNILVKGGITDFEEAFAPTEGDNIDDRIEE